MSNNNFPIDPSSVSFEAKLSDLRAYLESKPDWVKWKDFFNSSAGTTMLELIAGMSTYLDYQSITARRETYFRYAQNRSSLIAGSQGLGYSIFRGQNVKLALNITPNFTGVLPKWEIVGSAKDLFLLLNEDTTFNEGVPQVINVTIGELKTQELIAPSDEAQVFRFNIPGVSADVRYFIDNTLVDTSERVIDMLEQKTIIQSNALGSVDVLSLNSVSYSVVYGTNSVLKLEWIDLSEIEFVESDLIFDYGVLNSYATTSLFQAIETNNSISINAPLFGETQYLIRGRDDYVKVIKQIDTTLIDAGYQNPSPAIVELTAIRADYTLFSQAEKDALIDELSSYRTMGVEPPTMSDPIRSPIKLNVTAWVTGTGDPTTDIKTVTQALADTFEQTLDLIEIEKLIEAKDSIRIARIIIGSTNWASDFYQIGRYVKAAIGGETIYRMNKILYKSGLSEPTWPTTVGDTVIDNNRIVWECEEHEGTCTGESPAGSGTVKSICEANNGDWLPIPYDAWQVDTVYEIGNYVRPSAITDYKYKMVDTVNLSGASEPTWPALGGQVEDGHILWQAKELEGTPSSWASGTDYKLGDEVVEVTPLGTLMYQVVGYLGQSGASEPTFNTAEGELTDDNEVQWRATTQTTNPQALAWNEYYVVTEAIVLNG